MIEDPHDTLFDEEPTEEHELAHVDFDLLDTQGRWFLKVLSGPNTGAEFSMQSGSSYLIGTDTSSCDIIFQDLSVSRQHGRITVDPQDDVSLEDLNSRNGTYVDGEKIAGKKALQSNALISMGTTTFMLIDREGERQTIVSPVITPQKEEAPEKEKKSEDEKTSQDRMGDLSKAALAPIQSEIERIKEQEIKEARISRAISTLVVLAAITGIFIVAAIGTTMLFKTQEIPHEKTKNADAIIAEALKGYPGIRYSFNPATGRLLLIGHVLTTIDRNRILDSLQGLPFVSNIDYSNVVIDELVWREINQVLAKNPDWSSITINSPQAGKFVMSGFLSSRKQADALNDYITQNFPYLDLLERRVVVEEDLKNQIIQKINESGFVGIQIALNNGLLTLSGTIANGTNAKFVELCDQLKASPGIRGLQSFVREVPKEQAFRNISDKYQVNGYSLRGKEKSIVINGKILMVGDSIDGMKITQIEPNVVLLEKDGVKYRIDFNM